MEGSPLLFFIVLSYHRLLQQVYVMIKAKCTWKVQGDRPVSDAIVHFEDDENIDLEDAISAENCVQLEAPIDDDITGNYIVPACQVFLFCSENHQINSISTLSEARIIEVYGYHGEYLNTMKNELMEEVDGLSVFRGDLNLERPIKECCLKFIPLKTKESMWLYGIKIVLQQRGRPNPSSMFPAKIPMKEVEERLYASGTQISDKAEAFRKMMGVFQGVSPFMPMMQQAVTNLPFPTQAQTQFPQSSDVVQLLSMLQGLSPTAAHPQVNAIDLMQQLTASKPDDVQEQQKNIAKSYQPLQAANTTVPVQDQSQEAALTSLAELLRTAKTTQQTETIAKSPAAAAKTEEHFLFPAGKDVIMEFLERSDILSKENITALLTEIVKKSGAEFHIIKSLGDAEKPERTNQEQAVLPPHVNAHLHGAQPADVESGVKVLPKHDVHIRAVPAQKQPMPEGSLVPTVTAAVQTTPEALRDCGAQTELVEEEPTMASTRATQDAVLDILRENLQPSFEKMQEALQEQLLNVLGQHFEELKLQVVERVELKVQEMEERINARFDAIIDALQGQEEEEEIFEQPEEGSSI